MTARATRRTSCGRVCWPSWRDACRQARAALAAGKFEELTETDRGWWYFLQAGVADLEGQVIPANSLYDQAARAAVSELQRSRFVLGQLQARLRTGS